MKRISNLEFRKHFIGWQCRVRQIAMRNYEGRPLPPMKPRISNRKGEVLMPDMVTLLLHADPCEAASYFRFVVQKTHDPQGIRAGGLKLLAGDYFQDPVLFSDQLIAVFAPGSAIAAKLLTCKSLVMDFEGFGQTYRMFAASRKLRDRDAVREAALWHNRIFNPNVSAESVVLSFLPDWKTAQAEPLP